MVRPDVSGGSARGNERRRKQPRRFGSDVLRRGLGGSGTMAMEPGRMGSSAFESAELPTSYSSEFEAVEHRRRKGAADAATHLGLAARKSPASENPRSGSGPSESAGPERDETVEGVRNPGDGPCRVRQTRVMQISPPMPLKGRETPGGATRSGRTGEGTHARTLRGWRSLRKQPTSVFGPRIGRPYGGRPRGRGNERGGGGEPMTPLRTYGALREARRTLRGSSAGRRRQRGTAKVQP